MTLSAKLCNKDEQFEKSTIIPDFQIVSEKITFEKIIICREKFSSPRQKFLTLPKIVVL